MQDENVVAAILASGLMAAGKTADEDIKKALALYRQVAAQMSDEADEARHRLEAIREEEKSRRGPPPQRAQTDYHPHKWRDEE